MLRFNINNPDGSILITKFQYILCYGSTSKQRTGIKTAQKFQYILCYGSTIPNSRNKNMALTISIHPMLRFNWLFTCTCSSEICISIHPMLRFNIAKHHPHSSKVEYFNTSYVTVQRNRPAVLAQAVQISIHPMLRFNGFLLFSSIPPGEFQYILCYGSTFPMI